MLMKMSSKLSSKREHQRRGVKLFVLHHAHLSSMVLLSELTPLVYSYGAHRTHTEEFYKVTESFFDLSELREELLEWEQVYNAVRPHQQLGYVTPLKFLEQWKEYSGKEKVSLII